MATGEKAPDAFRTIGELATDLGVAQHILRYWETKFPELKPLQRAGNRRYYRPADVALARRINRLLNEEGYTVKGVQKLLRSKEQPDDGVTPQAAAPPTQFAQPTRVTNDPRNAALDLDRLVKLRDRLAAAIAD
ncbi:MerR family transcriptional regulator [Sphingomonas xanthus]|uniref:MerR family transcriptional regulator n=1 Tax=Sphingomonas xanthus TaxID=2594473 RepID=A0A516IR01_9SPHN|nr:MerR family transcriptional regulator [Sphingomonas xanthus]QDP19336.1 MerR family transcriptional regulator [Sphingomonas xanthus]